MTQEGPSRGLRGFPRIRIPAIDGFVFPDIYWGRQAGWHMTLNDYKTVLYRQEDGSWVAEVPSISGCYALMPTRQEALAELSAVFDMIAAEYGEQGLRLPADTTEIVHA